MKKPQLIVLYRLFFSLLGFAAIITEIAVTTNRGVFNPGNFFSYFTIQTNILVVVALLLSVVPLGLKKASIDTFRMATAVYMVIVGITFSLLLSGLEGVAFTAVAWDNAVLHYIIPIAMLGDFLIDRPKNVVFRRSLLWLAYPALYVGYTLIRGPLVGWYPYPFLDPSESGYMGIFVVVVGLLVLGVALFWGASKLSHRKK